MEFTHQTLGMVSNTFAKSIQFVCLYHSCVSSHVATREINWVSQERLYHCVRICAGGDGESNLIQNVS